MRKSGREVMLRGCAPRRARSLALQVCAGVRSMHGMEPPLAHRDIKPHNVLLEPRGAASDSGSGRGRCGGRPGPVHPLKLPPSLRHLLWET